jgi:hypothetical protein
MMAHKLTPQRWMTVQRLRASGCVFELVDHVRSAALEVQLIPTAAANLFPLDHGTGLLLPLAIRVLAPIRFQSFALRASWPSLGGRWSTVDPETHAYRFKASGRVLDIMADQAFNYLPGFGHTFQGGCARHYLLAELEDELGGNDIERTATLTITDSKGTAYAYDLGPLTSGTLPPQLPGL